MTKTLGKRKRRRLSEAQAVGGSSRAEILNNENYAKILREKYKKLAKKISSMSVEKSTFSEYKRRWKKFKLFATNCKLSPLPAGRRLIAYFMAHLANLKLKSSTIKGYLAAISFFHKKSNFSNPCSSPAVNLMAKGIDKINCKKFVRKPIKQVLLNKILNVVEKLFSCYDASLLKAIISLQFHGCMRIGEVVKGKSSKHTLKLRQVSISDTIKVKFESYKFSKDRKETLIINPMEKLKSMCPVRLLRSYLEKRPNKDKNSPIFLEQNGQAVKRSRVAAALKTALQELGLNPCHYNTHSLRSGKATQLHLDRFSDETIQKFGRWRSSAFKTYIKTSKLSIPAS